MPSPKGAQNKNSNYQEFLTTVVHSRNHDGAGLQDLAIPSTSNGAETVPSPKLLKMCHQ